ncbi:glycine oxidase ThiO [Exilibacterium tricleocarpae]|uniref:D-amino-acid oxidase n=1 Tax=Exilibacterium tricleocarpae TaxID=2591008 RepID=A0A545U8D8_9GAMM|nr:glycine oxidase ThiO [Exilibacterium tricleocarpae]TQV85731.1 glycine oxidase ThiO [Exilibacterium tricleocarpae]
MTEQTQRIAIAGAGLLGRLLAWRLLRRGHAVTLFEAGALAQPAAAAHTAAGMIAPLSEAVEGGASVYEMGMAALALWPDWLRELHEQSGEAVACQHNGSLIVAHPQDSAELLQFHSDLRHTLADRGRFHWLDGAGIEAHEPDLSGQFQQGLLLEDEAHIDNRHLLRALLQVIRTQRADCRENCAVELQPGAVSINSGQREEFDLVVDCRGVGAKRQWPGLRGVRGEVLAVQTPEVTLQRPVRLMHPRYQLYVVPKANHCFVIGATQIESEDRGPVTLRSNLELGSALYTLNPAFAEARVVELKANLRPALLDNLPRVQHRQGLISANGLYRHGYLLAPVVIGHILALIEGGALPFADALGMEQVA